MLITKLNDNYVRIEKQVPLSAVFDKLKAYNLKTCHTYDYLLGWLPATTEILINKKRCESQFKFLNGESITIQNEDLYNIFAYFTKHNHVHISEK